MKIECKIVERTDEGLGIPGYFNYVFNEYSVDTNNEYIKIKSLMIWEKYDLTQGDIVEVTYRKGMTQGLYLTEYDVNILIPNFD